VRLVLAVLAFSTFLGPSERTDMGMAHNVSVQQMTEAISARLVSQCEAWKNQDSGRLLPQVANRTR
jgi:hypothetical protein